MKPFPETTMEMARMVSDNLDFCSDWGNRRLMEWVQWFVDHERYYAVAKGGTLVGVTFVRFVDNEEDCHEHYRDTMGPLCYIEATVCKHPSAMKAMYRMVWNHLGKNAKSMAWMRHKYGDRITVADMSTVKRRLMRN